MHTFTEITGLALAAAAAGAINAVAGGGTLVSFPALLIFGVKPIVANATSTLALILGTSGGIYGYRQHLQGVKQWLWRFVPPSILGGLAGAILLTCTGNRTFSKLVPVLILFATLLFLAQHAFARWAGTEPDERESGRAVPRAGGRRALWAAMMFQFAVALYGGYFGAGIGILMLAALGFLGLRHIHQMNALKTILGSLINLVAAIWFIVAGLINWPRAAVMTAGAVLGYFLGSHYAQRIPQRRVRQIITLIGFALSAATFYQEFLRGTVVSRR